MASRREGIGLALWLIPEPVTYRRLSRRIARFSRLYGAPLFEPHVTLLSRLTSDPETVVAGAAELVASTAPIDIQVTDVDHGADYFRAVFLNIAPGGELLDAHERSRRRFTAEPSGPFRPHLSLLYADLDEPNRRKAVAMVREQGLVLRADRLWVVNTAGPVESWSRVAALGLRGHD